MKIAGHYAQISDTSHGCDHTRLAMVVDAGTRLIECTHCKKRWERVPSCCALDCPEPLEHPELPFCPEHMKDEQLVQAWLELT